MSIREDRQGGGDSVRRRRARGNSRIWPFALIIAFIGAIWIKYPDWFPEKLYPAGPGFSLIKDWGFAAVTALLIYALAHYELKRRARIENALRLKENSLHSIFDSSYDLIIRLDRNFCILFANCSVRREIGLETGQFEGKTGEQLGLPSELSLFWRREAAAIFAGGEAKNVDVEIRLRSEIRYFQAFLIPELDEQGDVDSVLVVMRDVSDIENAEQALLSSEDRLKLYLDEMREGFWDYSPSGGASYFSDRTFAMLGFDPVEPDKAFDFLRDRIHPDDALKFDYAWCEMQEGATETLDLEYRIKAADGGWRQIYGHGRCIERGPGQRALRTLVSHCDITDLRRTERHMYSFVESAHSFVIYRLAADPSEPYGASVMFVSSSLCEMLGVEDPEDFPSWFEIVHPEDRERVSKANDHAIRNKAGFDEIMRVKPNEKGRWRWIRVVSSPVQSESDGLLYYNGMIVDETEHVESAMRLERMVRAYRLLSESNQRLIRIDDEQVLLDEICKLIVEIGGVMFAWIGYTGKDDPQSLIPMASAGPHEAYLQSLDPAHNEKMRGRPGPMARAIADGRLIVHHSLDEADATTEWRERAFAEGFRAIASFPLIVNGHSIGGLNIYTDDPEAFDEDEIRLLTELAGDLAFGVQSIRREKIYEEHNRMRQIMEERFQSIFEAAPVAIFMTDAGLKPLIVNKACSRMLGYERNEILNLKREEVIHPDDLDKDAVQLEKVFRGESDRFSVEKRYIRRDGQVLWSRTTFAAIRSNEGRIVNMVIMAEDISQQREDRERIGELALFPEENPNPVLRLWRNGFLRYANPAAKPLLESWGVGEAERFGPGQYDMIRQAVETGEIQRNECAIGDTTYLLNWVPVPDTDYVNIYGQDITERRRLELELRYAQKMEAIGQLAGGVAHDFNNLLQAIIGYAQFLRISLKGNRKAEDELGEILEAARRAADLTHQLLAFGRRQVLSPRPVDLNHLVQGMIKLLGRLCGEDVEVAFEAGPCAVQVNVDPGQIEQVLVNLCINARDAMPNGGRIVISTGAAQIDEDRRARLGLEASTAHNYLSVSDNGFGIAPEIQKHIFEPFFTTKEEHGTGLGLASVYGIVSQHGGAIDVESEVGCGSDFRIYLPAETSLVDGPVSSEPGAAPAGGDEAILVAEDDHMLRTLIRRILEDGGYSVTMADDGDEALKLYEEHGGRFDLALLDMVMPGQGGHQVSDQLREKNPSLPVLFSTGYMNEKGRLGKDLDRKTQIIAKPYPPDQLLIIIRQMLDAAREGRVQEEV